MSHKSTRARFRWRDALQDFWESFPPVPNKPRPRYVDLAQLEDRILLSATPVPVEVVPSWQPDAALNTVAESPSTSDFVLGTFAQTPAETPPQLAHAETYQQNDPRQSNSSTEQLRRELAFVDTGIENYTAMVDDLLAQADAGRDIEVILLDADRDGIEQISSALIDRQDLDAIHLVSHGTKGHVKLGNVWLGIDRVDAYAGQIASWDAALRPGGDLMIYGCDLAATADGRALTEALSALCDCDVAASSNDTGSSELHGDWNLEFVVGAVETGVAFTTQLQNTWDDLLQVISVDTTDDVVDGDVTDLTALAIDPGSDGFISLREAILAANNDAGADEIILPTGTYLLTAGGGGDNGGDLDIYDALTITGDGAGLTIIDGIGADNILGIQNGAGTVLVSGVTMQNGTNNFGGAVSIGTGNLVTLSEVEIINNQGTTEGGGIYNSSTLIVDRSLIANNTAKGAGGILNTSSGTLTIQNSTISGNSATTWDGGGLVNYGTVTMRNATITQNVAAGSAGGLYDKFGATNDLRNSIVYGNTASSSNDLKGNFESTGFNLIGSSAGASGLIASDTVGVDPLLGSLLGNGGPTRTHALLNGSTAINAGTDTGAPSEDQRGVTRSATDIGAFEYNAAPSLSIINQTNLLPENTDTSSAIKIGDIVITDDGVGTNNLSLTGPDANNFEIVGMDLRIKAGTVLDYETLNNYDFKVVVDDPSVGASPDDLVNYGFFLSDVNETPGVTASAGNLDYLAGSGAVVLDPSVVVQDPEDALVSASVRILIGHVPAEDVLGFVDQLGISGSYNAATGILSLTGSTNVADYQTALRSVTYENTNGSPDTTQRVVSFTVQDGSSNASSIKRIDFTTNTPPSVSLTNLIKALDENTDTSSAVKIADIVITDDGNGTNNLSLSGADAASFEIVGAELRLKAGVTLDAETKLNYDVTVAVDDTTVGTNPDDTVNHTLLITSNVLVVDTTANTVDGNTSSIEALYNNKGADNRISLHEAILAANATTNISGADKIHFDIPVFDTNHYYYRDDATANSLSIVAATSLSDASIGDFDVDYPGNGYSWYSITPAVDLPVLTDAIIIDGTTQNGFLTAEKPVIEINGGSLSGNHDGLHLQGGGSTIRGLVINNFSGDGITISGGNGNKIEGNHLGTDVVGLLDRGNGWGVSLDTSDNVIGGTADNTGNVIGGNSNDGVLISGGNSNQVLGNLIGVGVSGNVFLGNSGDGIEINNSDSNVIGGNTAAARNVISDNLNGIRVTDAGATSNFVYGNYIGTDASGTFVMGNANDGISLENGASDTHVGGVSPGEGNLISGNNANGIDIQHNQSTGNIVQGNWIGLDANGDPLGNKADGIRLTNGTNGNTIGGPAPGEGNTIAHNDGNGIELGTNGTDFNSLRGNVIYGNGGLGIDLGADGITANDFGESAPGPNNLQNYPILIAAQVTGTDLVINGSLNSSLSTTYYLDFFASTGQDGSLHGEAERYLGSLTVATGGVSTTVNFNTTLLGVNVNAGEYVTATATSSSANTSEFALNVTATAGNAAPVLNPAASPALVTITEDAPLPVGAVGTLVSQLVDFVDGSGNNNITDADVNPLTGIALTAADTTKGSWYYSIDNGTNWETLGPVSVNSARLLAPSARIYFKPNLNDNGTLNSALTFRAWDQTGGNNGDLADTNNNGGISPFSSATDTASLLITAVNDDPVNQGTLPTDLNFTEDILGNLNLTGFNLRDVDANGGDLLLKLSTTTGGTVWANADPNIAVSGSGTTMVTLEGTVDDLNTYIATDGQLLFQGGFNVAGNNADFLIVKANDQGNTGAGGGSDVTLGSVNLDLTAVNDDPVNAGTLPGTLIGQEDTIVALDLSSLNINDVDGGGGKLVLTLNTTNGGTLSAVTDASVILTGSGTSTLTIEGTQVNLNAYLDDPTHLTFLGAQDAAGVGADTISLTLNDQGNVGLGGGTNVSLGTIGVNLAAVNDDPFNQGTLPTDLNFIEDILGNLNLTGFNLQDVDANGGDLLLKLSTTTGGTVWANVDPNITVSGSGTTMVTLEGTVDDLNTYIATDGKLLFQGGFHVAGNNADILIVKANDRGNTGTGGGSDVTLGSVNLNLTAVNDDPVNAGTLPGTLIGQEDTIVALDLSSLNINDVDGGGGNLVLTLNTTNGGTLSAVNDASVTLTGSGTSTLTIEGTQVDLNAYLDDPSHLTFLGAQDAAGVGADTISLNLNDQGNVGLGGGTDVSQGTIGVNLAAVNDDPVNQGSLPVTLSTTEDAWSDLDLSTLELADIDAVAAQLTLTISTTSGGRLDALNDGTVVLAGAGTSTLSLSGSAAALNVYLQDATHLQYLSALHANGTNVDTLQVAVRDNGNVGLGGGGYVPLGNVQIDVAATNDDPFNDGLLAAKFIVLEDTTTQVNFSALDLVDVDAGSGSFSLVLKTTAGGTLQATSGGGVGVSGSGSNLITLDGTRTNLNSFLKDAAAIRFRGAQHANGPAADTIELYVNDNGDVGLGGGDFVFLGATPVDITPVNDDPTNRGGIPATITVTEDTLSPVDLSALELTDLDADSANLQLTVQTADGQVMAGPFSGVIVTGSGTSTLTLTGSATQLNALLNDPTHIQYLGLSHVHGTGIDTLQIRVNDLGNQGLGGGNDIQLAAVQVDANPVNDAPQISNLENSLLTYLENSGPQIVTSQIQVNDVEGIVQGAVVRITGGYQPGQDQLSFAASGNISGVFHAASGTLVLSGADTVDNYQAALRTVTYQNHSDAPDTTLRNIEFRILDGNQTSLLHTRPLRVVAINDAPVGQNDGYRMLQGTVLTVGAQRGLLANDTDVDSSALATQLVSNAKHGTVVMQADGSFVYKPDGKFFGQDIFSYVATDGQLASQLVRVVIQVDARPMPPPTPPAPPAPEPEPEIAEESEPEIEEETTTEEETEEQKEIELAQPRQEQSGDGGGSSTPQASVVPVAAGSSDSRTELTFTISTLNLGDSQLSLNQNRDSGRESSDRSSDAGRDTQVGQNTENLDTTFVFHSTLVTDTLDTFQKDMNVNLEMPEWMAGTALFSSIGMSAGYILWSLRGGYMIASLLSAMPAWTLVDPLPVLEYLDNDDETDDESLQSMLGS